MSPLRASLAGTACLAILALAGCGDDESVDRARAPASGRESNESDLLPNRQPAERNAGGMAPADNTARNRREDGSLPTPLDQGDSAADRDLAARLRSALVDSAELSTQAKNIKIIVRDGAVTLRGVVESARERELVLKAIKDAAGTATIDDRLDIKS